MRRIHQKPPRTCPGSSQEASRRHPGATQEAPKRHPGSIQKAPRDPRPPRRLPERPKLDFERKWAKTIEFYCRKWKKRPIGVDETSATLTKYRK